MTRSPRSQSCRSALLASAVLIMLSGIPAMSEAQLLRQKPSTPPATRSTRATATYTNSFVTFSISETENFQMATTGGAPGDPLDNNKLMIYPGITGYASVYVDGTATILSDYVGTVTTQSRQISPTSVGRVHRTSSGQVQVEETYTITNIVTGQLDTAEIKLTATNLSGAARNVGLRYFMDTQIGANDGAPILNAGQPFNAYEQEFYSANVPPFFYAFEGTVAVPWLTAQGTMIGFDATPPDRYCVANWFNASGTDWNFTPDPTERVAAGFFDSGDSSVLLWWNPKTLQPGESVTYIWYYGLTSPTACGGVWAWAAQVNSPNRLDPIDCNSWNPNPFIVDFSVSNGTFSPGSSYVDIVLPNGLVLDPPTQNTRQNLGSLGIGQQVTGSWRVRATGSPRGNLTYTVQVYTNNTLTCTLDRTVLVTDLPGCTPTPGSTDTATPTSTPTDTPSPTHTPTPTPTPSPTPTSTFTRTPSPTPTPNAYKVDIDIYPRWEGREVVVDVRLFNIRSVEANVTVYVAIEIAGVYYFMPSFTEYLESYSRRILAPNYDSGKEEILRLLIEDNIVPPLQVNWYACLIDNVTGALFGDLAPAPFTLD